MYRLLQGQNTNYVLKLKLKATSVVCEGRFGEWVTIVCHLSYRNLQIRQFESFLKTYYRGLTSQCACLSESQYMQNYNIKYKLTMPQPQVSKCYAAFIA